MNSIDIVVPCYRYAHFLEGCIQSILNQRDVDFRILIVDDCSPDNTREIAERLVKSDKRINYVRNETNLGLVATANRGLFDWAEAEYCLLLSADDLLTPGALARATSALNACPDATFAFGPALIFSDNADVVTDLQDQQEFNPELISGEEFARHICRRGNGVPSPTAVVRTSFQKRAGPYNPKTFHTSDMEMWLRLAALGPVVAIDVPQAWYRWHASNMTTANSRNVSVDMQQRILAVREAIRACGQRLPELPDLLSEMRCREARTAIWFSAISYECGRKEMGDAYLRFAWSQYPGIILERNFRLALKRKFQHSPIGKAFMSFIGRNREVDVPALEAQLVHSPWSRGDLWAWWRETNTTETAA